MIPLCAACGEDVAPMQRCPRCDAPPSDWRPDPRLKNVADQRTAGVFTGGCLIGLGVLIGAGLWRGRDDVTLPQGFAMLGLTLICVLLGVLLVRASARLTADQWWIHRDPPTCTATVHTRSGKVVRGQGAAASSPRAIEVPALGVTGLEAFGHYRTLRYALASAYRVDRNTARVDLGLLVALLGLVARRRIGLRAIGHRRWDREADQVSRDETVERYEVRCLDAPATAADEDPLARVLLDAVGRPSTGDAPPEGVAPYRASATAASTDPPWTDVARVVEAYGRREPNARRVLRGRLDATLPDQAGLRPADEVAAELVAALDGVGDRALAPSLARAIGRGFAARNP
ncbi:MAG: hypothetical protein JWM10_5238 [Myxococcaceae bacterium]|nr:hypothetical protein [Myxococcaceae bacterium]